MASGRHVVNRRRTTWVATCAAMVLASACNGSETSPTFDVPPVLVEGPPDTTIIETNTPITGATTPIHPSDHEAPEPGPPLGPSPSFNESPGCGSLDGIRGPYADAEGVVPNSQTVNGPWGDFFGREIGEVRDRLVAMELPNVKDEAPVTVYVHERVAPALGAVIENLLREQELGRSYRLDPGAVFSFRPATVPPWRYLSFHAVGAAIDINPKMNPYRDDNVLVTDMPDWFVRAWTDAGWCWGGAWQQIKDAMHFSWKGPRYAPDYSVPERFEPVTEAADFTRSLTLGTVLGPAPIGSSQFVSDIDRDGAPDAIRVEPWLATDHLGLVSAEAIHGFDTCWVAGPTPHPHNPEAVLLLADRTGDARPDLWALDASADPISVTVFTFASGFTEHLAIVEVALHSSPATVFLIGDHDLDGSADLYAIEPGDPTSVEVRRGPGFIDSILRTDVSLSTGPGWQFALGLRDYDRVPDLFALGPADPTTLSIIAGGDEFRGPVEMPASRIRRHSGKPQTGDFDGDGRDDLYFFDADGRVTVYLGGDQAAASNAELMSWFLEGDDQPWEYRDGCAIDLSAPR